MAASSLVTSVCATTHRDLFGLFSWDPLERGGRDGPGVRMDGWEAGSRFGGCLQPADRP